jgi:hypothetical protein
VQPDAIRLAQLGLGLGQLGLHLSLLSLLTQSGIEEQKDRKTITPIHT